MRHVSLHDTIDTPSHTPAHTRLLERTPPYNIAETQQQCRHQLMHHNAATTATENITQDANVKMVYPTVSNKNQKQHSIWCEVIHIKLDGGQLTLYYTAVVCRGLCNQCIATHNSHPPSSSKACVRTVHEFEAHNAVSIGISLEWFCHKHPREWTKQAKNLSEDATEAYMVEVNAISHILKQQLISSGLSTCLLQWQGKEVRCSLNILTCAFPWIWPKWPKEGFRAPELGKL